MNATTQATPETVNVRLTLDVTYLLNGEAAPEMLARLGTQQPGGAGLRACQVLNCIRRPLTEVLGTLPMARCWLNIGMHDALGASVLAGAGRLAHRPCSDDGFAGDRSRFKVVARLSALRACNAGRKNVYC